MERLAVCRMRVESVRKLDSRRPEWTSLDPVEVGAGKPGEHLNAEIGDKAVPEISDGDVGDILGAGLDDGYDHDGGGDPVDHLLALADEHIVGRPLDQERYSPGGRCSEQHGGRGNQQESNARPQMLPPNAPYDLPSGIVDLELVGAPRDDVRVPEQ